MDNKEREIKIEHFHNLIAVAMADGLLDDAEKEFLTERAEELDMPMNEVQQLLNKAEELTFKVPLNLAQSEDQLSDIVYIMMIDGSINDKEYQLCLNIAKKLKLRQKDLDHVIQLIQRLWE